MTEGGTNLELRAQLERQRRHMLFSQIEVFERLKAKFGDGVVDVVEEFYCGLSERTFAAARKRVQTNDIAHLLELVFEPLRPEGLEYTVAEREDGIEVFVSKCPWHELYKNAQARLGVDALSWGYHMYCCTDPAVARGFNPEMTFTRTKTLMQGDDCCNHYYHLPTKG